MSGGETVGSLSMSRELEGGIVAWDCGGSKVLCGSRLRTSPRQSDSDGFVIKERNIVIPEIHLGTHGRIPRVHLQIEF